MTTHVLTAPLDLESVQAHLVAVLGDTLLGSVIALGELTLEVAPQNWLRVAKQLRDDPTVGFSQCIDLCGVDYVDYGGDEGEGAWQGLRFAVVIHLLSVEHNLRVRVRTFSTDNDYPSLDSLLPVWASVNWFEREAFDFFGIVFEGHPDLRRILTDYGFVGHPFRKDFPVSGHMEVAYDAEQGRVIYQPVTIAPRENVPRVIREESYGG